MTTSAQAQSSTETSPRLRANSENSHSWETMKSAKDCHDLTLVQLVREIYQQTVHSRASRILYPVKVRSLNAYFKAKEALLSKRIRSNVYNDLVKVWLEINMPFKNPAASYDQFRDTYEAKYDHDSTNETILNNFYKNAVAAWNSVEEPSFEEIKNACIIITAKTIESDDTSDFGDILSTFFLTLVNKHQELVSLEEFIYLIQNFEGVDWSDANKRRKMCEDFYIFGKRFIIVDFPLSSAGLSFSKLASMYVKDKVAQGINTSFQFIEDNVDSYVKKHKADPNSATEDTADKNIYVQRSLVLISKFKQARELLFSDFVRGIKGNKVYTKANEAFKMEQRYRHTLDAIDRGNSLFRTKLLNPAYSLVSFSFSKTTDTVKIILNGIDQQFKSRVEGIKSKYTHLKDASLTYCKGFVEITLPKGALMKYGSEIRGEISALYREVRELNLQKIKTMTSLLYETVVNQYQSRKKAVSSGSGTAGRTVI